MEKNTDKNYFSNVLYVADLPKETKNKDLEILFNKYQFVRAILNNSKSNKIWAQVILANEICATKARHELNGYFLIPQSADNDKSKGKSIRICKYQSLYNEDKNNKNIDFQRNLLIKNIDINMSQMEFYNIFLKYGDISSGKIEYDENGISKGFGYIYYYDKESAENAKNELNNKEFYGKKIQIVNLIPSKVKKTINNNTIFVLNLPNNITEKEIRSIFEKYGEIADISLTNKGYAFIKYNSAESASSCISDIKSHPICFSGLSNLVVKLATSKEEREANKHFNKNSKIKDDNYKIFFKYINSNFEEIQNIFDLDKKIRLFIKIILITEYIPSSVEINDEIKCAIVTFNSIKDCEIFVNKFKEYCINRRPMFNCIPYNKIKSQIFDNFINIEDYQNLYYNNLLNNSSNINLSNNNINEYNSNGSDLPNPNTYQYFNDNKIGIHNNFCYDKNQIYDGPLSTDIFYNNKFDNTNIFPKYSQMDNNYINHSNQSYQKSNLYLNNTTESYNNNNIFNNNLNNSINNSNINNMNNHRYHNLNNNNNINNNNIKLNNNQNIIQNSEYILLKPSEFNSKAKCIYNANVGKEDNNEENLIDISDSIYQIVYQIHPREAGKITGMIKELGLNKMNLLLSKPEDLNKIIEKAYNMILQAENK